MTSPGPSVLYERRGPLALVTLNRPQVLNALSLEMIERIGDALDRAEKDPGVHCVVLQGAGDRGYCAGGDVKKVVRPGPELGSDYAERFFLGEYSLDYRIHRFPKAFCVIAHGITMGGGIGLMAGASTRILVESSTSPTTVAMPEITIGLYPDVGASYFLSRMPGKLGLFLGLTAARLNAQEARSAGLADLVASEVRREELLESLQEAAWTPDDTQMNRDRLRGITQSFDVPASAEPSRLKRHAAWIEASLANDLLAFHNQMREAASSSDPWLKACAETFLSGSPTSAHLIWETWERGSRLSLEDCFRMELGLSLGCCQAEDFAEGVRALLIDKDGRPSWNPARLEDVSPQRIQGYFAPHPLASGSSFLR